MLNLDNSETRRAVEMCYRTQKTLVNPIIDWTDDEVWEFLNEIVKVPHCSLYDEGFKRIGCIGCPMGGAKGMRRDFERWPKYKELYIKAMERMVKRHPGQIKIMTGEDAKGYRSSETEEGRALSEAEMAQIIFKWWICEED